MECLPRMHEAQSPHHRKRKINERKKTKIKPKKQYRDRRSSSRLTPLSCCILSGRRNHMFKANVGYMLRLHLKKQSKLVGYIKFGKTPFAKAQVFLLLRLWLCQLFGLSLVARL